MNKQDFKNLPVSDAYMEEWSSRKDLQKVWKEAFVMLIHQRMEHCMNQLKSNIHNATISPDEFFINYANGKHFSVPVYEAMENFINNSEDITRFIAQQAMRQHLENFHNLDGNWNEIRMFLNSNGTHVRDFENFLTEVFLVA